MRLEKMAKGWQGEVSGKLVHPTHNLLTPFFSARSLQVGTGRVIYLLSAHLLLNPRMTLLH
jgi:hypothetical protein